MAKTPSNLPNTDIQKLIDRILESNQITRQEHLKLTSAMLSTKNITEENHRQINRIFDQIQLGRLVVLENPPVS
ncbi:MAG: hypothetical protein SWY16_00330 [Cyanobacteriota bacterium]|nr:hypothetical protein [Cyanobacteriota bacterium]